LEALGDSDEPSDDAVHDARKELKNARAGLRLVRDALGGRVYRREDAGLPDAPRPPTAGRGAKGPADPARALPGPRPGAGGAGAATAAWPCCAASWGGSRSGSPTGRRWRSWAA